MIDIGVNLTNPQLLKNVEHILQQAAQANIEAIIITGTDIQASEQALALCRQFNQPSTSASQPPKLFCTAGVHPHDAKHWNSDSASVIQQLALAPEVVAVGEAGLDFNRNFSTPEQQQSAFKAQIELAITLKKPLFLHERNANSALLHTLDSCSTLPPIVVHCFTGNQQALNAYVDRGFSIGITGWVCDERRGQNLAEIVSSIPLDRLMIETDAPYLLPRNIKPKPKNKHNYPKYLPWVCQKIADCYGLSSDEIAAQTSANSQLFFGLNLKT